MKRDPDLVRDILLAVEANDDVPMGWMNLEIEGRNQQELAYHVQILHEAGLLVAQDLSSIGSYDWRPRRLTAEGHDFLDAARSDTVWQEAKKRLGDVGGFALEVAKPLLIDILKQRVGL